MDENFILVTINEKYCSYLRKYDYRVSYNQNTKNNRPFVGILFKVNNFFYFAPLTSPKKKHIKLKNKIDFLKIDNGILGAINFNNMIPVNINDFTKVEISISTKNVKYNRLLQKQLFWLNRHHINVYQRAIKLYFKYKNEDLPSSIKNRCCNFVLLEQKCNKWSKKNCK